MNYYIESAIKRVIDSYDDDCGDWGYEINDFIKEGIFKVEDVTDYVCKKSISARNLYHYAMDVDTCDKLKVFNALISIKDFDGFVEQFLADVENVDYEALEKKLLFINKASYIYAFATNSNAKNIQKLEDRIIELNDLKYIYNFAKNVEGANIQKLEDVIINTDSASYIFSFAREIPNANIQRLEDRIIELNDLEYIYNFAKYVKGANIQKLESAIISSQNIEYIVKFAKNIDDSSINLEEYQEKLMNRVCSKEQPIYTSKNYELFDKSHKFTKKELLFKEFMEIDDDDVRYELLNNRKYRVLFIDESNKKSNTNKVKKIKQNRH